MMIIIFWEMTPCGSYMNRRFGGSYRLNLQGARVRAVETSNRISILISPTSGGRSVGIVTGGLSPGVFYKHLQLYEDVEVRILRVLDRRSCSKMARSEYTESEQRVQQDAAV
jgi:hypothetical protein